MERGEEAIFDLSWEMVMERGTSIFGEDWEGGGESENEKAIPR